MAVATKAQVEALRWLLRSGRVTVSTEFDSTALWSLYEQKKEPGVSSHPLRVVAWKRVSGANMSRMERAGLLERVWHGSGLLSSDRVEYRITEAGMEAAK